MFSPVPKHANVYVEAIVLYQDGNTKNWAFPRVDQLSYTERYQKETLPEVRGALGRRQQLGVLAGRGALYRETQQYAEQPDNDGAVSAVLVNDRAATERGFYFR